MTSDLIDRRVLRWDHFEAPDKNELEFFLTYEGELFAHRPGKALRGRTHHVHKIRKKIHRQLKALSEQHPNLGKLTSPTVGERAGVMWAKREGFNFGAFVSKDNNLLCKLDITMLRHAAGGRAHADIDNRVKTLFDALRLPRNGDELGGQSTQGKVKPDSDEDPFFVLLEDDAYITHLSVSTGLLLEPVPNVAIDDAVRLMIGVTIWPFASNLYNNPWL